MERVLSNKESFEKKMESVETKMESVVGKWKC